MSDTPIPSIELVKKWKRANVVDFLKEKKEELELENEDIQIIDNNRVNGRAFLELSQEDLERWKMPGGPAKTITILIENIKGETREHEKKRKAKEELTITKLKRKKWMVNSMMHPYDWDTHYFADPAEQNAPLLEKIRDGHFVVLYGTRASGKSTRVQKAIQQLEHDFVCNYLSLEYVNINSLDNFWKTLGLTLSRDNDCNFESCNTINSAQSFLDFFSKNFVNKNKNLRIILFLDEFDKLLKADSKVCSEVLDIFRGIRNTPGTFAIHSVVAIGTFSILHIDSSSSTSPFNIKEPFQNPSFTLNQVQKLYEQFAADSKITIDPDVVEDIYAQTNGHAGLVCLCGRAIEVNLIQHLEEGTHLSYDIWQRFSMSLVEEVIQYQTFRSMVNTLLEPRYKNAMDFFRSNFLVDIGLEFKKVPNIDNIELAEFLAAEGVLLPGRSPETFKISSPLVRWLILSRVIPKVYPSCPQVEIPFHSSSNTLDILEVLKQVVRIFDKKIIEVTSCHSFKMAHVFVEASKDRRVPRESVYDSELYRILSNWLSIKNFQITGQWHLISRTGGRNNHKYSDIIINSPDHPTVVLELLATAKQSELDEHFERALTYAKLLSAGETWVIHFSCEDKITENPYWPADRELKKGLRVVHFWHDLYFTKIKMIACWWDVNNNTKHVTGVEEFMVS
nr:6128_t:CDS:2 [Entrophospora candida]